MADVTEPVSVFEQVRLVAGLRWRIMRNSLRKKNNRLDLIGLIFAGLFGGILVIGLSFAFYAGAYAFLSRDRLEWMALLFWGLSSVCWLLAMTAGATAAKPGVLPAMLLIVGIFVLLNVTIERLIGSWLERLLARRRTRELFLGLFLLSMISLNFLI